MFLIILPTALLANLSITRQSLLSLNSLLLFKFITNSEFDKALQASLTWSGLDKVLIPMLGYLVNE